MSGRSGFRALTEQGSVSELELFFDLVFVFAITRVTQLMLDETTWLHVLHAGLVLMVLWWVWVGYAWLGNVVAADRGWAKLALFGAIGGSFVLALAIPQAFTSKPGGLSGPLVFAAGYFVVRAIHLTAFWALSAGDEQLRGQLRRWTPRVLGSVVLFVCAGFSHGALQTGVWCAALLMDYVGTRLAGDDWRLNSARHFAERHGLIIIVALGESVVEIGTGVASDELTREIIAASLLGLLMCALLWWTYFDITAPSVQRALRAAHGQEQIRLARSCYTFIHLPLVGGIVGVALGLEQVLGHLDIRLPTVPLVVLFGGVALYLIALIGFKYNGTGTLTLTRVVAVVVVLLALPLAGRMSGLATLSLLTAILAAMVVYETLHFPEVRASVREEES